MKKGQLERATQWHDERGKAFFYFHLKAAKSHKWMPNVGRHWCHIQFLDSSQGWNDFIELSLGRSSCFYSLLYTVKERAELMMKTFHFGWLVSSHIYRGQIGKLWNPSQRCKLLGFYKCPTLFKGSVQRREMHFHAPVFKFLRLSFSLTDCHPALYTVLADPQWKQEWHAEQCHRPLLDLLSAGRSQPAYSTPKQAFLFIDSFFPFGLLWTRRRCVRILLLACASSCSKAHRHILTNDDTITAHEMDDMPRSRGFACYKIIHKTKR